MWEKYMKKRGVSAWRILSALPMFLALLLVSCTNMLAELRGKSVLPVTYIGTKAPTEAKAVGDIVFTDGSATPYSADLTLTDAQKAAAIAVIFYVGTECSNDTSSRTLGVGLVHNTSGLAWCTQIAHAYYKVITAIQCPRGGHDGAYTFSRDKDGSDNLEQIGTFLANNSSVNDIENEAEYPAFYFAKNYRNQMGSHVSGTRYEKGWYLPTVCELFYIQKNKATVDAASSLCGGSQFGTSSLFERRWYWSSTQGEDYNRAYSDCDEFGGTCLKDLDIGRVCCIRAFD